MAQLSFEIESVFKHSDVLCQIALVDASERPEEIPQPCPEPFARVAMNFIDAVTVVIAGKFPGAVGDGAMFAPRSSYPVVSLRFVGVKPAASFSLGLDFRLDLVDPCAETDR
jgi:hypothetical protein